VKKEHCEADALPLGEQRAERALRGNIFPLKELVWDTQGALLEKLNYYNPEINWTE
jgi:hypothetical protein